MERFRTSTQGASRSRSFNSCVDAYRQKTKLPIDNALIKSAESQGLAERIDRTSDWGNPYDVDKDGTREEVIEWYREYFAHKRSLHKRLDEIKGKVLICWCHPEDCHGRVLIDWLSREAVDFAGGEV